MKMNRKVRREISNLPIGRLAKYRDEKGLRLHASAIGKEVRRRIAAAHKGHPVIAKDRIAPRVSCHLADQDKNFVPAGKLSPTLSKLRRWSYARRVPLARIDAAFHHSGGPVRRCYSGRDRLDIGSDASVSAPALSSATTFWV
jgi:hypothetical protein